MTDFILVRRLLKKSPVTFRETKVGFTLIRIKDKSFWDGYFKLAYELNHRRVDLIYSKGKIELGRYNPNEYDPFARIKWECGGKNWA